MSSKPLSFPIPFEVQAPTCPVITDKSVLDAIGNTPLIRIQNIGKEFKNVYGVEAYFIPSIEEWKEAYEEQKKKKKLYQL